MSGLPRGYDQWKTASPYDDEPPCMICERDSAECECPVCSKCGAQGDPTCFESCGLKRYADPV